MTAIVLFRDALEEIAALAPLESVVGQLPMAQIDAEVGQAERALREATTPPATVRAYSAAVRYWCAWAHRRLGTPLPMPTPANVVKLFILDHFGSAQLVPGQPAQLRDHMPPDVDAALVNEGYKAQLGRLKITTVDHRLAVLAWLHRVKGFANTSPLLDYSVKELIKNCRTLARQVGQRPQKKTPLVAEDIHALLATCDESLAGKRDRALLLLAWTSGGRRRSEVAGARVGDIEWVGNQEGRLHMRSTKTNDKTAKRINAQAAAALRAWLAAAEISEGPVFRRILRGGKIGAGLTPHAIDHIVKRRVRLAGLTGDYAAHSLRRGFVTEAQRAGVSIADTMAMTGHRSVRHLLGYADGSANAAADLLDRADDDAHRRKR